MRGFVYVLSNKAMPGLLKVGFTTRTIIERINELNSTGVPSSFVSEFYFEVSDAPKGEQLLHSALREHHYDKEFFKLPLAKVVEEAKKLLYSQNLVLYGLHGRAKDLYITEDEKRQLQIKGELKQKQELAEQEAKTKSNAEIEVQGQIFLELAPKVNKILKEKSILGGGGIVRNVVGFALIFSVVGAFASDKVLPAPFDDGVQMIAKLSGGEKDCIKSFYKCTKRLQELNGFERYAKQWSESIRPNDFITGTNESYMGDLAYKKKLSDLISGVFSGLSL
jgi:hypothetical protein